MRSNRSRAIRARVEAEKPAASFGHHAPDAPKPVIVWAARAARAPRRRRARRPRPAPPGRTAVANAARAAAAIGTLRRARFCRVRRRRVKRGVGRARGWMDRRRRQFVPAGLRVAPRDPATAASRLDAMANRKQQKRKYLRAVGRGRVPAQAPSRASRARKRSRSSSPGARTARAAAAVGGPSGQAGGDLRGALLPRHHVHVARRQHDHRREAVQRHRDVRPLLVDRDDHRDVRLAAVAEEARRPE